MKRLLPWMALVLLVGPAALAQDIGETLGPVDELLGDNVPPVLDQIYGVAGQNLSREDVRMFLTMNFTKAELGLVGLLVGSGTAEVEAHITLRVEMRVISSDRVRAAAEGDNAYNVTAENATFLSQVFIPAEVFRATLSAEVIAAFQEEQEAALRDYLDAALPELEVLGLDVAWTDTEPQKVVDDASLTEPPITVAIDASVRYLRTESIPSLLRTYLDRDAEKSDAKKEDIERLKRASGDPPKARDFFGAAAYTQLLNLSMQPGWALFVEMRVPRGYSFEYANEEIQVHNDRHVSFAVDALAENDQDQAVLMVSLTHRRAVILTLFVALLAVGALLGAGPAFFYVRHRLPGLDARWPPRAVQEVPPP